MPKKTNDNKPWERQPGESEKAFEAFSLYLNMGADRTITAVVKQLEKSRSLIDRWKARWEWSDRVREYDNDKERQARKEAEKGLRDMYARQTKIAMSVQTKALQALDALNPEDMSVKDIKEYIKMATDLERLNRSFAAGQHEEKAANAHTLADTIIAAYEKRKDGEGQ
jgi:hypothetical protein